MGDGTTKTEVLLRLFDRQHKTLNSQKIMMFLYRTTYAVHSKSVVQVKHYKTDACNSCPVKDLCTKNKEGRLIERSQHAQFIEQNKLNIEANKELYKKRQAIVEHPYGVLKRQWGFYYIMTKKGKKRASADVGCMFIAYNLRRILNILDQDILKKFFQELAFFFLQIVAFVKAFLFPRRHAKFSTNCAINLY